jgi:hypothetical protein
VSPHLRAVADARSAEAEAATEIERVGQLYAAFVARFGPNPDTWPEHARLAHDRATDDIHHYYGQEAA